MYFNPPRRDFMTDVVFEAHNNRSAAYNGELEVGTAEITIDSDIWTLDEVFVDPDLREKGIGEKLVSVIVEEARKQGKSIKPMCSYAESEFEEKKEYEDVLAQ